jgi:hypothetical protein
MLPIDCQWLDNDYMQNFHDFTLDHEDLADLGTQMNVSKQHHNVHFMLKLEPGIPILPDDS